MRRRRNGSAVEMQTITGEETYSLLKLASFKCDTDGSAGCVLAVKFQFRSMMFYFNR